MSLGKILFFSLFVAFVFRVVLLERAVNRKKKILEHTSAILRTLSVGLDWVCLVRIHGFARFNRHCTLVRIEELRLKKKKKKNYNAGF